MVDDSMKNTGLLFLVMRTTRLIVAMFVLFAICKPAVANVVVRGAGNLAPDCENKIKELCKNHTLGALKQVDVNLRGCKGTCTYRPPGSDTVQDGEVWVPNRKYEDVTLPKGMPCGFGAACDNRGKCFCEFCI
uniref:Putative early secreted salivary protein n=1 Tax=Ixodes scapularis TaxID=6945 RepID=Q4PN18_IXOSC|nr:putative early secreted salivary protein [Ixodes scapularis]